MFISAKQFALYHNTLGLHVVTYFAYRF